MLRLLEYGRMNNEENIILTETSKPENIYEEATSVKSEKRQAPTSPPIFIPAPVYPDIY